MPMPQMSRKTLSRELRDYLMITVGMLSYTIGWTLFLLPNHITTGGVAGISSLLFWATAVEPQWYYFAINVEFLPLNPSCKILKFSHLNLYQA